MYLIAFIAASVGSSLGSLGGEAGKRLANLLCYFLVAYLGLQRCLLGLVLLLLVLALAGCIRLLLLLLLLAGVAAFLLARLLLLIGNGIDIDALLAKADALLAVSSLSFLCSTFAAALLVCLLLRTCGLVQAVQVNLALDGQAGNGACCRLEAEDFFLLLSSEAGALGSS